MKVLKGFTAKNSDSGRNSTLKRNRYSANEKIICDFDKFDILPFERKRELANAVIKKIYATSDKIDIIWNI